MQLGRRTQRERGGSALPSARWHRHGAPLHRHIETQALLIDGGESQQRLEGGRELLNVGVAVTQHWLEQAEDGCERVTKPLKELHALGHGH